MHRPKLRIGRGWIVVLLVVAGIAPYALNLNAFFLSDDFVLLSWTRVSTLGEVAGFFDPNTEWFYRPVVKMVFWSGQSIFGFRAAPFHLLSLVLHAANALLLYLLVSRSRFGWIAGLSAALLFLMVPQHAETVSWASAVGDLIGTLCILANLLLLRRYLERDGPWSMVGALALFVVGLLARETVLLLPGLVLLYLLVVTPVSTAKLRWRPLVLWLMGYVAIVAGYLALLATAGGTEAGLARGGLGFRSLNFDSILLGILDYTHRLVPGGELLASAPLDVLRVFVWVEWLVLLGVAWVLWRFGLRYMLFGLAWLLYTPLAFVFFSPPTDRYFYLPSVGFAILFGCLLGGLPLLVSRNEPEVRRGVTLIAALALFVIVVARGTTLVGEVAAWRAAGQASGGIVNDVRQAVAEPRDYGAFYFVDLPIFLGDVPVFQNGLQQAVQETFNNTTITAQAIGCDDLAAQPEFPRYSYFFRYKPNGVTPFAAPGDCQ